MPEGSSDLAKRTAPTVLTPHAGELARLLETDSAGVERERLNHVRLAADRSCAVVVLKGDDTLIAEPSGKVAVSPGDSPALATAGTGDVLTGVIAALLAQGLDRVHGGRGRRVTARRGRARGRPPGRGGRGRDRLRCDRRAAGRALCAADRAEREAGENG